MKTYKDTVFVVNRKKNSKDVHVLNNIPLIDVINWKDEKTGDIKERKIRYVKGAVSIFADEQPNYYDANWEKKDMRPKSLPIHNGAISVSASDIMLMQFMKLTNFNGSNPSRRVGASILFTEFDPESVSKKRNTERDLRIQAENKVRLMDKNELRSHLISSEEGTTMESLNRYRVMEEEQLRDVAYNKAYKDPKKFLADFQLPSTANKYIIINAILRNLITFNEQTNIIAYPNGDVLMGATNGMNSIDALAEFGMTSEKYKEVINSLKEKMLDRMSTGEKAATVQPKVEPAKDMYDTLIDKCMDAGIISATANKAWFTINNKPTDPAEKVPTKTQGRTALKDYLKTEKLEYLELMERLEGAAVVK